MPQFCLAQGHAGHRVATTCCASERWHFVLARRRASNGGL